MAADWLDALLYQQDQIYQDAVAMGLAQAKEEGITMDIDISGNEVGEQMFGEAWYDEPIKLDWTTGEPVAPAAPKPSQTAPAAPPVLGAVPTKAGVPWVPILLLAALAAGLWYYTR